MTYQDRVKRDIKAKENRLKQLAERVKDQDENEQIIRNRQKKLENMQKIDPNQFENDYKRKIALAEEKRRKLESEYIQKRKEDEEKSMKPNLMTKPGHVRKSSTIESVPMASASKSSNLGNSGKIREDSLPEDQPTEKKRILKNFSNRMNEHAQKKELKME